MARKADKTTFVPQAGTHLLNGLNLLWGMDHRPVRIDTVVVSHQHEARPLAVHTAVPAAPAPRCTSSAPFALWRSCTACRRFFPIA